MSLPALRKIGTVNTLEDMKKVASDIEYNFEQLKNAPRLIQSVPAAGHVKFLVIQDDGTWNEWELVAGANVGFTLNTAAKTLTVHTP